MSDVDPAIPYDPEQGLPEDVSGSFDPLDGPRIVVLLGGERGESDGWAPRAALGLVRGWSREGRKMVVVDVGLEAPSLHALLGEENGEGVSDMVLYGASVQRVACRPDGEHFVMIPAGTPVVDAAPVLEHPRWNTILSGFREAGADLALYVPATLPGVDRLLPHATLQVLLGDDVGMTVDQGGGRARLLSLVPAPEAGGERAYVAGDDLVAQSGGAGEPPSAGEPAVADEPVAAGESASDHAPSVTPRPAAAASPGVSDDGWMWADPWGLPSETDAPTSHDPPAGLDDPPSPAPAEGGLELRGEPEPEPGIAPEREAEVVPEPALEPATAAERRVDPPVQPGPPTRPIGPSTPPLRIPAPTPRDAARRREIRQPPVPAPAVGAAPPDGPGGESSPAGVGFPGDAISPLEPVRRTGPVGVPPGRAPRRTGLWVLVLLLIVLAAVLGAARLGYLDIPGVTPAGGGTSLPGGLTTAGAAAIPPGVLALPAPEGGRSGSRAMSTDATPPPGDGEFRPPAASVPAESALNTRGSTVVPSSSPHTMSLALNAYSTAWGARRGAEEVRAALPSHPVVVAPVNVRGRLFYRLAITGAVDAEAAEALRGLAVPAFPAGDPAEWFVRRADRGFLLGEATSLADARARAGVLEARDLPAYVLEVPLSDGTRVWRIHAGAYATDGEAAAMASLLERAGEGPAPLVPLTGHPPE